MCGDGLESVDHMVRSCPLTHQILVVLRMGLPSASSITNHRLWLTEIFKLSDEKTRKLVVLTLWAVWHAQNKLMHDGIRQTMGEIMSFIFSYLNEIDAIRPNFVLPINKSKCIWKPHEQHFIKIN